MNIPVKFNNRLTNKLENIAKNKSIVESTLIIISLAIFFVFIFLYMFIYNTYWNQEKDQKKLELSLITFDLYQETYAQLEQFYRSEAYANFSLEERDRQTAFLLHSILDDLTQKYPSINLGYINYDTNLKVSNDIASDPNFPAANRPSENTDIILEYSYNDSYANECMADMLPLTIDNQNIGYVWAKLNSAYIYYNTQRNSAILIGSSILLLILILVFIRKLINQIKSELITFSDNIISQKDSENIYTMDKLPELAPVFKQIQDYAANLRNLNDELLTIMNGISDGFFTLDHNFNYKFVNDTIKKELDQDLVGLNFRNSFFHNLFPGLEDILRSAVQDNKPLFWEVTLSDNREFEFNAYPFSNGISVFFRDTTDKKRQTMELIRLERLNLIGQMAAGISHEVRNPLTTVKGFLQIFYNDPSCFELKEDINLMLSEMDRANSIIGDFLSLAKSSTDNYELIDINQIIGRIYPLVRADAYNSNKNIELSLGNIPNIMLNESEIRQVLLNFVRNGLEASPINTCMLISTYTKESKLVLEIKDEGQGLPEEVQAKFGTPFFTTKENGTGLGLAISIGILERHHAVIEYDTGIEGTTFYILFDIPEKEKEDHADNHGG